MKLLTTVEAAKVLGVTVGRVQALILEHRLPAQLIGRDYIINADHLKLVENRQPGRTPAQLQLDYWSAFQDFLQQKGTSLKLPPLRAERYMAFAVGKTGFRVAANIRPRDKQIWVDLTLDTVNAKRNFHRLLRERDQIEKEIGTTLEWHERSKVTESWILVRLHDTDPADPKKWPEQHEWLKQMLEAFHRTFKRRATEG